jgi:hypothetical protein
MTDKPRVILDAKAWQEGLATTEGDCSFGPDHDHIRASVDQDTRNCETLLLRCRLK